MLRRGQRTYRQGCQPATDEQEWLDPAAKEEQYRIIVLLLEHGASPNDFDAKGKTVAAAALSDWIRQLLDSY